MRALTVFLLFAISGSASAQLSEPTVVDTVVDTKQAARMLLGAFDVPLTMTNMRSVGVTEDFVLEVARNPAEQRYLRLRAVGALGLFATPRARGAVEALARSANDEEVRVQAVISLARAFKAAVSRPLLGSLKADPSVRVSQQAKRELIRMDAR